MNMSGAREGSLGLLQWMAQSDSILCIYGPPTMEERYSERMTQWKTLTIEHVYVRIPV